MIKTKLILKTVRLFIMSNYLEVQQLINNEWTYQYHYTFYSEDQLKNIIKQEQLENLLIEDSLC